jgi:hypothetical protein
MGIIAVLTLPPVSLGINSFREARGCSTSSRRAEDCPRPHKTTPSPVVAVNVTLVACSRGVLPLLTLGAGIVTILSRLGETLSLHFSCSVASFSTRKDETLDAVEERFEKLPAGR